MAICFLLEHYPSKNKCLSTLLMAASGTGEGKRVGGKIKQTKELLKTQFLREANLTLCNLPGRGAQLCRGGLQQSSCTLSGMCLFVCLTLPWAWEQRLHFVSFVSLKRSPMPASQWVPNVCFVQLKSEQWGKQDIWSGCLTWADTQKNF